MGNERSVELSTKLDENRLEELMRTTNLTKKDIYEMHKGFIVNFFGVSFFISQGYINKK